MLVAAGLAAPALAAATEPPAGAEPHPFRLDAVLTGRDFVYNTESFLHRYAFRMAFPLVGGARDATGFYGASGSTRADEFWLRLTARERIALGEKGLFDFRFRRDEDFDGRYDELRFGLGRHIGEYGTVTLFTDVHGDKSLMDVQLETAWEDGRGNRARVAVVAVDFEFNQKQDEAVYVAKPWTLFADGWWQAGDATVYVCFNRNTPVFYRERVTARELEYEQTEGGIGLRLPLSDGPLLLVALEGLTTSRTDSGSSRARMLEREHGAFTLELAEVEIGQRRWWFGLRRFALDEEAVDETNAERLTRRREILAYTGTTWRLGAHTTLRTELLIAHIANQSNDFATTARPRRGPYYGKFAAPLELILDRRSGALLRFGPTIDVNEVDKIGFGGAVTQLIVPF